MIQEANGHRTATAKTVTNWINHQHSLIVADFQADIEQVILDLFMEKVTDPTGGEHWQPRMLGENYRNSITVAKDYLQYLKQRIDALSLYVQQEFDRQFYPGGTNQPSLIAQWQAKVQEKIRAMQASPGDHTHEQEDYLRTMDQLLEAEVWHMLVQAVQRTLADIQAIVEGLWETIGTSAQGWCFALDSAREASAKAYSQDETRRLQWTEMRLRTYLPTPGAEAEEALFAQVADPHLDSFFNQSSWHIAINPMEKGANRYQLVLEHPSVSARKRAAVRMQSVLGQELQVDQFNPDDIVGWAERQLQPPLEAKSIWDIMELDFQFDWLPAKGRTLERLSASDRSTLQQQYVTDRVNRLINQSNPLWTLSGSNFQDSKVWGIWGNFVRADAPATLAERFSAELQRRGESLRSSPALPHEIRRAAGYFRAPLTAWSYYPTCLGHYLNYLQTSGVLVDIYPHEQNAHRLRQWVQRYVDPTMRGLLDVRITGLLSDLDLFRCLALCYTMKLIPTKSGSSGVAADVYCLGHTELGSVLEPDQLCFNVLKTHFRDDHGVWHPNDAVHRELRQLWKDHEAANANLATITGWLNNLGQQADALALSTKPGHQPAVDLAQLRKAFQAAVYSYIDEVKAARQLP